MARELAPCFGLQAVAMSVFFFLELNCQYGAAKKKKKTRSFLWNLFTIVQRRTKP